MSIEVILVPDLLSINRDYKFGMCTVVPYDCTYRIISNPIKNFINISESFCLCSVGKEILKLFLM